MSYARSKRISEEIKKIVSGLLMNEIKDPRISKLTTVTDVETTRDLRFTYIYVSIFDNDRKKA
jgi:ribosome-binding factor A